MRLMKQEWGEGRSESGRSVEAPGGARKSRDHVITAFTGRQRRLALGLHHFLFSCSDIMPVTICANLFSSGGGGGLF